MMQKFCHGPLAPKEVQERVSDRGGYVRSGGEAAYEERRQGKGTAIMKLTTMTQVTGLPARRAPTVRNGLKSLTAEPSGCVPGRHAPGSRRGTIEKRKPSRIVI